MRKVLIQVFRNEISDRFGRLYVMVEHFFKMNLVFNIKLLTLSRSNLISYIFIMVLDMHKIIYNIELIFLNDSNHHYNEFLSICRQ